MSNVRDGHVPIAYLSVFVKGVIHNYFVGVITTAVLFHAIAIMLCSRWDGSGIDFGNIHNAGLFGSRVDTLEHYSGVNIRI